MPARPDAGRREPAALSRAATVACGLLLGSAVVFLEIVQQPIARVSLADIAVFVRTKGPVWLGCGLAWAFVARAAEPRVGVVGLLGIGVATTACLTAAVAFVDAARPIASSKTLPMGDFAAHAAWTNAFYGGLYLAVYAGWRRSVRSARALAHVRQAQDESAALLQLSRVESYRRALQPQTILQSVDALRRLYRSDPAEADALLDTLVGFLRGAVRSLNAERCAFPEELDLAWRYLQLRQRTVGGVGVLSVERSPAAPDIPFPPRLLMPILEAVCLAGCRVDLRAGWRDGAYGLDLTVEGAGAASAIASLRRRIDLLDEAPDLSSRLVETPPAVLWSVRVRRPAAARALVSVPSSNSGVPT